jgi:DNA-binding NtrC family response regulator
MSTLEVPLGCIPNVLRTRRILRLLSEARQSDPKAPVLLRGEPGVGKDVMARLVHATSARQPYSFIKTNCRARPLDLCGADLFGQERGREPQTSRRRPGSFEYANHGTIYLDEIAAMPLRIVAALGRVLKTGEIVRADNTIARVDVLVIASTTSSAETGDHADLWEELRRLNATEIYVPPLRERVDEIATFASFFGERFARQSRRNVEICPEVMSAFEAQSWPGNLRELETAVHRLALGGATASRPAPGVRPERRSEMASAD